jgi:uncharacterized membrane protein
MQKINRSYIKTLYSELPVLEAEGIVSTEISEQLKNHYGELPVTDKSKLILILFSVLGALSISAGILSIVAYNWDDLPKVQRLIISLIPLFICQFFSYKLLTRKKYDEAIALYEVNSLFLITTFYAAFALVTQIYHVSNDISVFLQVSILLTIPVLYIFNTTTSFICCVMSLLVYILTSTSHFWKWGIPVSNLLFFWGLTFSLLPHLISSLKKNVAIRLTSIKQFLFLSLIFIAVYPTFQGYLKDMFDYYLLVMQLFFVISILLLTSFRFYGNLESELNPIWYTYPIFIIFTITWIFNDYSTGNGREILYFTPVILFYAFIVYKKIFSYKDYTEVAILCFPLIALMEVAFSPFILLLHILYPLIIGVSEVIHAVRKESYFRLNWAMILLLVVIAGRFLVHGSFIIKGISFILLGVSFIAINFFMFKKRRIDLDKEVLNEK